ncbi:MAG: carbohydrate binding domain-containing protein [Planctomycetota bacterium]
MFNTCRCTSNATRSLALGLSLAAVSLSPSLSFADTDELPMGWLNIHGIGWDGPVKKPGPQLRLARGLGYRYVYHGQKHDNYEGPHRADLFFYYNDPHKHIQPLVEGDFTDAELAAAREAAPYTVGRHPMLPRAIDMPELDALRDAVPRVFEAYKAKFEATKSWANTDQPFPDNLAQLQTWGDGEVRRWEPSPDYQRESVIEDHVAAIINHVKAQERPAEDYLFKGVVFDVPEIWKEFNWSSNRKLPGTPEENRSAVPRAGITYDHGTLQEGWYHFLNRLHDELELAFPGRDTKVIHEPAAIWADWGQYIADIPYDSVTSDMMDGIRGDALVGEKPTLEFLTQKELADDGWPPQLLGNVTADLFPKNPSFPLQLVVLGETAARGSNFFSYGTFAREFHRNPHVYSNDLKLIRIVAGWENSHDTPLEARLWDYDNRVYLSPTAVADEQSLATVNPYTGEIQGVLRDADAVIQLADGVDGKWLRGVNQFFEPTDKKPPVMLEDGVLKVRDGAKLPAAFRLQVKAPPADNVYFSHPLKGDLVHRPQEVPYIMREVYNPDFELGPEGWYTGDGGRVRVVRSADVKRSGELAGKLVDRSKAWHSFTQRIPDVLNVKGPGTYRVSGWVRMEKGNAQGRIHMKVDTATSSEVYDSKRVRVNARGWTKLEAEFEIPFDDTVTVGNLSFRINNRTVSYYLDDVSFEKVD